MDDGQVVITEGSPAPYMEEGRFMEAGDGWYVVSNGKWAKAQTFHIWLDMPPEKLALAHFKKDPHYFPPR